MTNRVPVLVIGGYLGAGKTTFINACLSGGLRDAAIIVNDFGSVNVDASLISSRHGDTLELTNGCVCCSVGTSLAETLFTILDRPVRPSMILIEASGVADPAAIAAFTHLQDLSPAGVLVLVDACDAPRTASAPLLARTFERQLRAAHVIALTKTDIATPDSRSKTTDIIARTNTTAPVVEATPTMLATLVTDERTSPAHSPDADLHSPFTTTVHDTGPSCTREDLDAFLSSLPSSVVRAKGIVALADGSRVLVQRTGSHTAVTATDLAPTGLVLITAG